MVTYTEYYSFINGKWYGVKDISASRFYYLSECKGLKNERKINRDKYNFMRRYKKSHYDYIVYNPENIQH